MRASSHLTPLHVFEQRRHTLLLVLSAILLTNALLAELIGGKLFSVQTGLAILGRDNYPVIMSSGIVLWPVVFIMTDIINEYFGRRGVRRLSLLAAVMIAYAFVALWLAGKVTAIEGSPVSDEAFTRVFTQTRWIIAGSITAFLVSQLIDVSVFWFIRTRTGAGRLWLRATGSTVVSQLVDSFVVGFIGLYLPFALDAGSGAPLGVVVEAQSAGYLFKLCVAVAITPLLYLVHAVIDRFLGVTVAEQLIVNAAQPEHASANPPLDGT